MDQTEAILQAVLERNTRVEREKAWETSWTRRLTIAVLTWIVVTLFLWQLGIPFPFLQALVPTGGYVLSTLSLPWIKRRWMRRHSSERPSFTKP
ncbi:MAG: hypothetical protein PHW10_05075 [Candidatus Peribacteraceae bacterium]|nr:hypothetical protein [Candidatus Peribacteraceae bacterium]